MELRMQSSLGSRLLCLVFASISSHFLCASRVLAQESIRASLAGDAAAFASRPSLSNAGYNLQLGPVLARFSASLGLEFNDNITLSQTSRESDLIVRPSLEANVAWQAS